MNIIEVPIFGEKLLLQEFDARGTCDINCMYCLTTDYLGGSIAQRYVRASHPGAPGSNLGASDFLITEISLLSSIASTKCCLD